MFIIYFQTSLNSFPAEKLTFSKEYGSGIYGLTAYFLSKLVLEIPLTAVFPFTLLAIIYYIVGFNPVFKNYLLFVLVGILQALVGMVIGLFLGTVARDVRAATETAPMIFIPFMLFCGFLTNVNNILPPLRVFEYMSPMRYSFEFFIRNEFEYNDNLGAANPVNILNFNFSRLITVSALLIMLFGYIILTGLVLKFTTKQIMN